MDDDEAWTDRDALDWRDDDDDASEDEGASARGADHEFDGCDAMATKTNDDDARRDASADATRAPAALSYGSVFTMA